MTTEIGGTSRYTLKENSRLVVQVMEQTHIRFKHKHTSNNFIRVMMKYNPLARLCGSRLPF